MDTQTNIKTGEGNAPRVNLPDIGTRQTFKVKMFRGDMGSFTTNANSWEDLLWHVNSARDHDGLPRLDLEQLKNCQPTITKA